jgi:hypothetical protein
MLARYCGRVHPSMKRKTSARRHCRGASVYRNFQRNGRILGCFADMNLEEGEISPYVFYSAMGHLLFFASTFSHLPVISTYENHEDSILMSHWNVGIAPSANHGRERQLIPILLTRYLVRGAR